MSKDEIRTRDSERKEYMEKNSFKVEEIWECEFRMEMEKCSEMKDYITSKYPKKWPIGEKRLIEKIRQGRAFGIVECDIEVPESLKSHFAAFPPSFKNTVVTRKHLSPRMLEYAEENSIMTKGRRLLVSSMTGEKIMLASPILLWYLRNGLEITKIHSFIEYTPSTSFLNFVQYVSDVRREGDSDPSTAIRADSAKLVGNSSYGYQGIDKIKQRDVEYVDDDHAAQLINSPLFHSYNEMDDQLSELCLFKKRVVHD
jgi:hypothetical protein